MEENILEIKNMGKSIGKFNLNNIDFSIKRGFVTGFLGRNGAGKTSTIRTIMNLYVKDSGEINVFGMDNFKDEKAIKDRIGYVSDERLYFDDMRLDSIRKIVKPFYSKWSDDLYFAYMERFELDNQMKAKNLSKGSYKKFSIVMALAHKPELLILDEPTSDLDPIFRNEFLDILREYVANEKNAVFFSSHITNDLDKIADYIILIDQGRIKINDSKEDLINKHMIVKGKESLLNEFQKSCFVGFKKNTFGLEGLCNDLNTAQRMEKEGCLLEIPTLEDIMFYTIKREARWYHE